MQSAFYEDAMFKDSGLSERENYACNQSLTTNLTMLEVLLEVASKNQSVCAEEDNKRRQELYSISRNPQQRCLYCAKKIQKEVTNPADGCDDVSQALTANLGFKPSYLLFLLYLDPS